MTPWIKERIVMLDVETTGLHDTARIVQMASVIGEDRRILRGRVLLVDPGEPIPKEASDIHGVTDDKVAGKPRFDALASAVAIRIESGLPAAYNAPFDRRVFAYELALCGFDMKATVWLDPLPWVRHFDSFPKGKKLSDACRRRGIPIVAHDALSDASAALELLYTLEPKLPRDLEELRRETERMRAEQDREYQAYLAKKAAADEKVAQAAAELAAQSPTNDAAPEAAGA